MRETQWVMEWFCEKSLFELSEQNGLDFCWHIDDLSVHTYDDMVLFVLSIEGWCIQQIYTCTGFWLCNGFRLWYRWVYCVSRNDFAVTLACFNSWSDLQLVQEPNLFLVWLRLPFFYKKRQVYIVSSWWTPMTFTDSMIVFTEFISQESPRISQDH